MQVLLAINMSNICVQSAHAESMGKTLFADLIPAEGIAIIDTENTLSLYGCAVKILVFLTMPVDPTSHQVAKQVEYLQHFKVAIVEGDAIAVIMSHLEEPLQNLERWVTYLQSFT
jgi:hypothetical protein